MEPLSITTEFDAAIPMRDGTILRADIYRPSDDGAYPTVILRTPYDKSNIWNYIYFDPIRFAKSGYAVVKQDCRGCSASDGDFYPWGCEAQDGYDTVEWVADQAWSNKRVGMLGYSYPGSNQWMAAREQPPHLTAIAPGSTANTLRMGFFRGGVFQLQLAQSWVLSMAALFARRQPATAELQKHLQEVFDAFENMKREQNCLPLKAWSIPKKADYLSFYNDWLSHPSNDEYWRKLEVVVTEKTKVPAYIIGGWHDLVSAGGSLASYTNMVQRGGSESARKNTKIIIGPWGHGLWLTQRVGEIDYGMRASAEAIDLMGIHLRWFDHWLKGIDNGILDEPPVRIFVMGDNVWRNENEWPLARTQYTNYYMHGSGQAHTGGLSLELPENEDPDSYDYDPLDPVPTCGGSCLGAMQDIGPIDQSVIETRADVLVYTTPELTSDLEVTGPVTMKLFAQSSAPDTDFTAKLVDVWPNGKAYILLDGIVRARYRDSDEHSSFIDPGRVYEYTIDLVATSNVFRVGHRIRVEISSSNFPKYDRNPNTGHEIGADSETLVATQKIFHDSKHPSHLILPVIPR